MSKSKSKSERNQSKDRTESSEDVNNETQVGSPQNVEKIQDPECPTAGIVDNTNMGDNTPDVVDNTADEVQPSGACGGFFSCLGL